MAGALTIAFRNLIQARRRTFLLGVAVAVVSMLFLTLRSIANSVTERMIESATTLSAGHVNIAGFFKDRKKGADAVLSDRDKLRRFVMEKVPDAERVIDRNRGWGRIVSTASSLNAGLSGIIPEEETTFFKSLRLAPEREYMPKGGNAVHGSFENMKKPNSVLIFAAQAKKLEVKVGDTLTIVTEATGGQSNTVDLEIAAIASDIGFMSNWSIFVTRDTILNLYQVSPDTTGVIMLYLKSPEKAMAVMEQLRKDLSAEGYQVLEHDPKPFFMKFEKISGEDWLGQKIDLTIWSDEISFVLWVTTALDFLSFLLVGILSLIIIGGISNTMWMSVRERTKEIGTMRAIGAQRGFIVRVFMFESMMLGFFASLIGGVTAFVILFVVNQLNVPVTSDGVRLFLMANALQFSLHPGQLVLTLLLFSAITGCAALYPAFKASRMRPVVALAQGK